MTARRSQLLGWIEDGSIPAENVQPALSLTGIRPTAERWRHFLDQLLLFLGALSLACSVVFFIAYNWDALGHYSQFALVQALMVISLVLFWWLTPGSSGAHAALLVATVLLGALLALFGQTYQTGADPWQLFATWALLMLPWLLVSRSVPLWLLFVALLNMTLYQYHSTFPGWPALALLARANLLWMLWLLNTIAWAAWELATPRFAWLEDGLGGRWGLRLVTTASGIAMTNLVLRSIFGTFDSGVLAWPVYAAWLAVIYLVYRRRLPDLFILSGACLSLIVCFTALFADLMLQGSDLALSFLLLAMLVIAQAAFAAVWLRRVNEEHSA